MKALVHCCGTRERCGVADIWGRIMTHLGQGPGVTCGVSLLPHLINNQSINQSINQLID